MQLKISCREREEKGEGGEKEGGGEGEIFIPSAMDGAVSGRLVGSEIHGFRTLDGMDWTVVSSYGEFYLMSSVLSKAVTLIVLKRFTLAL